MIPASVIFIFSTWELFTVSFPRGREHTDTKTYVHRLGTNYAITRLVTGQFAGHLRLPEHELRALGDLAL